MKTFEGSAKTRRHTLMDSSGWEIVMGFDHGASHPILLLDDAKAPNGQKNNGFSDLGNYSEWPKVAGAVVQAL